MKPNQTWSVKGEYFWIMSSTLLKLHTQQLIQQLLATNGPQLGTSDVAQMGLKIKLLSHATAPGEIAVQSVSQTSPNRTSSQYPICAALRKQEISP